MILVVLTIAVCVLACVMAGLWLRASANAKSNAKLVLQERQRIRSLQNELDRVYVEVETQLRRIRELEEAQFDEEAVEDAIESIQETFREHGT